MTSPTKALMPNDDAALNPLLGLVQRRRLGITGKAAFIRVGQRNVTMPNLDWVVGPVPQSLEGAVEPDDQIVTLVDSTAGGK
jgi:hypothetical protein